MPSPIGHALAGVAAGCLVARCCGWLGVSKGSGGPSHPALTRNQLKRGIIVFGFLGVLPDIDFLFGIHASYTHSFGAMVLVGLTAGLFRSREWIGSSIGAATAVGSHVMLDWLGTDETFPYGVMALWPISDSFFLSGHHWFIGVCREYSLWSCWLHNACGLAWELIIIMPVTLGVLFLLKRDYQR